MKKDSIKVSWVSPAIVLTLLVGVTLSISSFLVIRAWEWQSIQHEFERIMDNHTVAIRRELDLHLEVLLELKSLYEASESVSREEFHIFAQPALLRYPSIQALEWVPRVKMTERSTYERSASDEGFSDFSITERDDQGNMVPIGVQAEYFPVYYIEPYEGNEAALGFDLSSNPRRLVTLIKSRESGQILVTSRITLVQEKGEQFGFLIFAPIYKGHPDTSVGRYNNLKGFVLGVFRIGDIIEHAFTYDIFKTGEVAFWLYDDSAPPDEQLLHAQESSPDNPVNTHLTFRKTINIAGRSWSLVGNPTNKFIAAHQT